MLTVQRPAESEVEIYTAYAYSYPHKTAYRRFNEPLSLSELWRDQKKDALFLYAHIPFCEMRCGFCNLFTTTNPEMQLHEEYLETLKRQASRVRNALGTSTFSRMAIGGGTPTYLNSGELDNLFSMLKSEMGADSREIPVSVETSPLTADRERLAVLRSWCIERMSIGVQSFIEEEVMAAGRAQRTKDVHAALNNLKAARFPVLNIDLIYGLPKQTPETWLESIKQALSYSPEEIYLYPLYVRPLTGLDRMGKEWQDIRLHLYRLGRQTLLEAGYEQTSMRMFRKRDSVHCARQGPMYCCQQDGMIGLGCGARSYTTTTHYSFDYGVSQSSVRQILQSYVATEEEEFDRAVHGFHLSNNERARRYVIQSLLQVDGLDLAQYKEYFRSSPFDEVEELSALLDERLAEMAPSNRIRLTERGLEMSDAISFRLYSPMVRQRMKEYQVT